MKKYIGYFFVTIGLMFLCCVSLKAEELTCKYKNPYSESDQDNLVFVFKSDSPENYSIYSTGNTIQTELSKSGMYINSNGSSINKFYVGNKPLRSPGSYYSAPGSKSFAGTNWIFAPSMIGKSLISDGNCPALTFSESNMGNNRTVVIHAPGDTDCNSYANCSTFSILQAGNSNYVGTCTFPIKYQDFIGTLKLTSYSDGSVEAAYGNQTSKVDFNAVNPIDFTVSNRHGNIVESTRFYIGKDDFNQLVSINSSNQLKCKKPVICANNTNNQYSKSFFLSTSSDNCPTGIGGNPNYNEGEVNGDGDVDVEGGNSTSTLPNMYVGSCVDYLGSADTPGTIASYLDSIYDVIKVVAVLIVIALSMVEFAKAVSSDKEKIPEVVKKLIIRLLLLLALLLLPMFIELILGDGVLCGIK